MSTQGLGIALVSGPVTSLVPNNPAGIISLGRALGSNADYFDLNTDFFLEWTLNRANVAKALDKRKGEVEMNLLEEVEITREAFKRIATYRDFSQFRHHKRVLEEAVEVIGECDEEKLSLRRNSIRYNHKLYKKSRSSLLRAAEHPGVFKEFIEDYAVPKIEASQPHCVGISITHPDQYVFALQLARVLRQSRKDIIVLLGGNTITRRIDTWLQSDDINRALFRRDRDDSQAIDGIVVSEGEYALNRIIENVLKRPNASLQELFKDIPGVVYRHGDAMVCRSPEVFSPEMIWKDASMYHKLPTGFMPDGYAVASIVDGRVCTYECATGGCEFCAISKSYIEPTRRIFAKAQKRLPVVSNEPQRIDQRALGAQKLAAEIHQAYMAGIRVIDITDEQFTLHQALCLEEELDVLGLNKGKEPDIVYSCYMRTDSNGDPTDYEAVYGESFNQLLENPRILARLKKGGLRFAQFGLETVYPPKRAAMVKGGQSKSLQRFGKLVDNLGWAGIMSHVFVIVGAPLKTAQLAKINFRAELQLLGHQPDETQLEILEALYNLQFLQRHRAGIYTLKQTQFKLARHSPQAEHPVDFGIDVASDSIAIKNCTRDLDTNLEFGYIAGRGVANQVIKDLLRLYDLWKKECLPYQLVTETYMYAQRCIPGLTENIPHIASTLTQGVNRLTNEEKAEKQQLLKRLWRHLVGTEYADKVAKKAVHREMNKPLDAAITKLQDTSPLRKAFPTGFSDYEDLYTVVNMLESFR